MSLRSNLARLGLTAAVLAGTILPALAVSAVATTPLNVRSCGSTDRRVVDVLQRGEEVEVRLCEGVWCAVEKAGPDGWVNANYLERGYADDDDYYDDEIYVERRRAPRRIYRYNPFIGACIGGRNARFCVYD